MTFEDVGLNKTRARLDHANAAVLYDFVSVNMVIALEPAERAKLFKVYDSAITARSQNDVKQLYSSNSTHSMHGHVRPGRVIPTVP